MLIRLDPRRGLVLIRHACASLRRTWHGCSHRNQHWVINIAIGLGIEIALIAAHDTRLVVAAQNWALDTVMQAGPKWRAIHGGSVASQDFAFIDVDEETWRNPLWGDGEPFRAPRDGLLKLIDFAITHNARYIVLDVIVESPTDSKDIWFADEIQKRVAGLNPGQQLFFVRTLREPLPGLRDQLAPELRSSPLDKIIEQNHLIKKDHAQLHAVAPYFRVSRDGVLRDWQMWRAGCRLDPETGTGHWEILPSVQLAIAAIVFSNDEQKAGIPWNRQAAEEPCAVNVAAFARGAAASTATPDARMRDWLKSRHDLTESKLPKPTSGAIDVTNRIFFRLMYPPVDSRVRLIPALTVLKPDPHREAPDFRGGIVVIGQSFEAARDQHMTPLGVMPGAMVLINSLDSMLNYKMLHENAIWDRFFTVGSIVVIGYIFACFDSLVATIVILMPFLILLLGANYILLRFHVWFDFSIPLLGLYLHRLIASIEEHVTRRRDQRHR